MSQDSGTEVHTYLPVLRDTRLYQLLVDKDYEGLAQGINPEYPYERIGVDRLLAILTDLSQTHIVPPARVLDIGCNTGLFSYGLASQGYTVVGVDSNIAAEVQGYYPGKIIDMAQKGAHGLGNTRFEKAEISEFLARMHETFDICLLLSVVHQWREGYASSGKGAKPISQIKGLLEGLVSGISQVIYYEGPDEDPVSFTDKFTLPHWFCEASLVREAIPIGLSAAANGELRTLYRLIR